MEEPSGHSGLQVRLSACRKPHDCADGRRCYTTRENVALRGDRTPPPPHSAVTPTPGTGRSALGLGGRLRAPEDLPWPCRTSQMTNPAPSPDPRYSMDLRISVVMTRHEALGEMVTSPVMSPTSPNASASSRYFWLDSALSGDVYTTRVLSLGPDARGERGSLQYYID